MPLPEPDVPPEQRPRYVVPRWWVIFFAIYYPAMLVLGIVLADTPVGDWAYREIWERAVWWKR